MHYIPSLSSHDLLHLDPKSTNSRYLVMEQKAVVRRRSDQAFCAGLDIASSAFQLSLFSKAREPTAHIHNEALG